jgi:hypothetical protein
MSSNWILKKVSISNFKSIDKAEVNINLNSFDDDSSGFIMIEGPNGISSSQ